jgi:hypothetical protein
MPNEHSVQAGSQPSRPSSGDLSGEQPHCDKLAKLTRLYETLTKSSPLLRRGPLSTTPRRSHSPRKGLAQSLNVGVARKAIKYAALVLEKSAPKRSRQNVPKSAVGSRFSKLTRQISPFPPTRREGCASSIPAGNDPEVLGAGKPRALRTSRIAKVTLELLRCPVSITA